MSWPANPPPQVASMRTVLTGLLAFTSRSYVEAQVHYPDLDPTGVVTFPAFVLILDGRRQMRVLVYSDPDTQGDDELQTLAMELSDQLPSRYRTGGLVIATDPDISDVGESSDSQIATDSAINVIEITCQIGLDPGT